MCSTAPSGPFDQYKKRLAIVPLAARQYENAGGHMKAAVIFSVPMSMSQRFVWRWRSEDHTENSTQSFRFYADCTADAERNGYKVGLRRIVAGSKLASGP